MTLLSILLGDLEQKCAWVHDGQVHQHHRRDLADVVHAGEAGPNDFVGITRWAPSSSPT